MAITEQQSNNKNQCFYRIDQIVGNPKKTPPVAAIIPVSKRKWYAMVATGAAPKPVRYGRCSLWRKSDIDRLVSEISGEVAV
jgi:predicted DNA-binding transcriptional regulator AlpA